MKNYKPKGYRIESKRKGSDHLFVSYGPGLNEEHAVLLYQSENPDAIQIVAKLVNDSWSDLMQDLQIG